MTSPRPGLQPENDCWQVYTDGSSKRERRQTFSGWAALAAQSQSRQLRRISGGGPGGDSLWAESEAIVQGLKLVPAGARAHLYSDLDLAVILGVLRTSAGEAAWQHLRELHVHPTLRNSAPHALEVHQLSRDAEEASRRDAPPAPGALTNAAQSALFAARALGDERPLPRGTGEHWPGPTLPLQVRARGLLTPGGPPRVSLELELPRVHAGGPDPQAAREAALRLALTPLVRGGMVELEVEPDLYPAALAVARTLGTLRVRPPAEQADSPPT